MIDCVQDGLSIYLICCCCCAVLLYLFVLFLVSFSSARSRVVWCAVAWLEIACRGAAWCVSCCVVLCRVGIVFGLCCVVM